MLFTATTCTEYTVNGVRPVTVSSVVADVKTDVFPLPSPTTCSVIWYIRMEALLSAGSSHSKKMDVVLACKVVTTGVSGGPVVGRQTTSCTTLHLILVHFMLMYLLTGTVMIKGGAKFIHISVHKLKRR